MKIEFSMSAFVFLISCSSPKYMDRGLPFISRASAIGMVEVTEGKEMYRDGTYYIVPIPELRRVFTSRYLTYLGTENGFHLFRHWTKIPQNENEVWLFALKFDSCNVAESDVLKEEFRKYSTSYRRVEFLPGCIVRKPE